MTWQTILIAVFVLVVLGVLVFTVRRNRAIRQNGIEADAAVTRIEESCDSDGDYSYAYYVEYRTLDGRTVEARLGNEPGNLRVGSRLRIQYLPEKPGYVLPAKRADQ